MQLSWCSLPAAASYTSILRRRICGRLMAIFISRGAVSPIPPAAATSISGRARVPRFPRPLTLAPGRSSSRGRHGRAVAASRKFQFKGRNGDRLGLKFSQRLSQTHAFDFSSMPYLSAPCCFAMFSWLFRKIVLHFRTFRCRARSLAAARSIQVPTDRGRRSPTALPPPRSP